jgi:hypothetical protein
VSGSHFRNSPQSLTFACAATSDAQGQNRTNGTAANAALFDHIVGEKSRLFRAIAALAPDTGLRPTNRRVEPEAVAESNVNGKIPATVVGGRVRSGKRRRRSNSQEPEHVRVQRTEQTSMAVRCATHR